jgi:ribosome-associated protein
VDIETNKELVLTTLNDLKGEEIVSLPVDAITDFASWIIVVSGRSTRHMRSMADNLKTTCKEQGVQVLSLEGVDNAEWALIDLGDIVVNIMQPQIRAYYQIEKLWQSDDIEEP